MVRLNILWALTVLVSSVPAAGATIDDASAVENLCFNSMPESEADCRELLSAMSQVRDPSIQHSLEIGEGYLALALGPRAQGDRQSDRNLARTFYRDVLGKDPANGQALFGLAVLANEDERYGMLMHLLSKQPAYAPALQSVSRRIGHGLTEEEEDAAVRAVERGYRLSAGNDKWVVAIYYYAALKRTGDEEKLREFREQVLRDLGVTTIGENSHPENGYLSRICSHRALRFDVARDCHKAMLAALEKSDVATGSSSSSEILLQAFIELVPYRYEIGEEVDQVDPILESMGVDIVETVESVSPEFLMSLSAVSPQERKISLLLQAAAAEGPHLAMANYWLGEALNDAGEPDEAIRAYQKAISLNEHPYSSLAESASERLRSSAEDK